MRGALSYQVERWQWHRQEDGGFAASSLDCDMFVCFSATSIKIHTHPHTRTIVGITRGGTIET